MAAALVLGVPVPEAAADPPGVGGFSDHCLILCTALSKLLMRCQRPFISFLGRGGTHLIYVEYMRIKAACETNTRATARAAFMEASPSSSVVCSRLV